MDLYTRTSYELAERLTMRYSTSFSMSSRLFDGDIRRHIYAIYGMVRLADEIVDTYNGTDARERLEMLEQEAMRATETVYSTNPIIHAYGVTAQKFGFEDELARSFYESMTMDLEPREFDQEQYEKYIYGSAEVIGLMCLRVFLDGDAARYEVLKPGARALGAAYQKVNFLRDMRDDHERLGRVYFPDVQFETFDDEQKHAIEADIEKDFELARSAIAELPSGAKPAVMTSYEYYYALFDKLKNASAETVKSTRLRTSNMYKFSLLARRGIMR